MIGTIILLGMLTCGIGFGLYVLLRLIGKEPPAYEFRDEHLARLEANVKVEGPGTSAGQRRTKRYAIAVTDRRLVLFQWGKAVLTLPHAAPEVAQIRASGSRIAIDIRELRRGVGGLGLYLVETARPALWLQEIQRWRELAGPDVGGSDEEGDGGDGGT